MNREQQIEEMAKSCCGLLANCNECKYGKKCEYFGIAEDLYNAGYRKMDEVTLKLDLGDRTPEEIKQIVEMFKGEIKKQVAREILNTLNRTPHEYHEKKIKELAKFYGVEIEE